MIEATTYPSEASTLGGSLFAALAGLIGGRLLVAGIGPLLDPPLAARSPASRWLPVAVAVAAVSLWWWEVICRGVTPATAGGSSVDLAVRCAFHGVLFLLLAAATWVDFRHRVIPDAITVPGVLAGLAAVSAWPGGLLPVVREVPRSFALPLRELDVLGAAGPLGAAWPTWLEPSLVGLACAALTFAIWWLVGTAPPAEQAQGGAWQRLGGTRTLVAAVGATVVMAAWLTGGDHWRGLVSSLAGLAVAAGIVWLTRAGASQALGREAMGLGDVTLMAMIGAWLGWQACVLACFLAVFIGLAHGVVQLVLHRDAELPFGPSLCLGAVLVVVGWRPVWGRAEAFFEQPLELAAVVAAVIALTAVTLWVWHRIRPISAG